MRTIEKYLLFAYLLENIFVQTFLMGAVSDMLFYPLLGLGVICMFTSRMTTQQAVAKYWPLFVMMGLYVFYEFALAPEIDTKTLLYLIAKVVTLGIIIVGLNTNEEFYRTSALRWLIYAMAFFLLYGLLTGGDNVAETGRMRTGFTNENTVGAMGANIVGLLIFYLRDKQWTKIDYLILALGVFGVLAGASRAGFLMLSMLVVLRYGINMKTLMFAVGIYIFGVFILPQVGIHTVGIDRMMDTIDGTEGSNREVERLAAQMMIAERPLTGWGFQAENQGEALLLSELGSHSGYLEIIKQMGYPVGITFFATIAISILLYLRQLVDKQALITLAGAMVIVLLVKANYEGLFVGVHEFETNLFFFFLAMMSLETYILKNHDRNYNIEGES